MPLSAPRLPGLRFETARPPAVPGLPRMDVAAFVGFASAGPVGVPVAVDDAVRFRELFGPDLPLAWDPLRGETVYAHLAPAVREFFRNGGRRCWIVRAGDEGALETAAFRVPGMLHGRGRSLRAAFLLASSPGSWADGMSLNATLQATLVSGMTAGNHGVELPVESPELLKLEWPDSGTVAFFPPHPGAPERDQSAADRSAERVRPFSHAYWFRLATWTELQPVAQRTVFLAGPVEVPLQPVGWQVTDTGPDPHLDIHLAAEAAPGLQPGCWVRITFAGQGEGGVTAFMEPDQPEGIPSLWASQPSAAAKGGNQGGGGQGSGQGGGDQGGGNQGGGQSGGDQGGGQGSGQGGGEGGGGQGEGGQGGGQSGGDQGGGQGGSEGGDQDGGQGEGQGGGQGEGHGGGQGEGQGGGQGQGEGQGGGQGEGEGGGQGEDEGGGNQGDEMPGDGHPGSALLGKRAYLLVDEVRREQGETVVVVRQAWRTLHHGKAPDTVTFADAQASLVSVELWTRHGDGSVVRLPDVGLVPRHPRFLGSFPPDQVQFAPTERLIQSTIDPAAAQLSVSRTRLAAPDPRAFTVGGGGAVQLLTRDDAEAGAFAVSLAPGEDPSDTDDGEDDGGFQAYLPLGVPTVLREDFYQAAHTSGRSALERDGLGAFSTRLFLDEELAGESAETLLDTAFYNAYVAEPPRPPVRMHALLPVEEVSLLAVPDAVHTGWEYRTVDAPPPAPEAPYLVPPQQPDAEGRILVQWGLVAGALEYELQDSPDPRFRARVESTRVEVPEDAHPDHVVLLRPRPCPDRLYFRVRVRTGAGFSAWSETVLLDLPGDAFQGCGRVPLAAPVVTSFIAFGERLAVFWAPAAEDDALRDARAAYDRVFRVEMSPEPTFGLAELLYEGTETKAETWKPQSGALFFRAASWLRERPDGAGGCACIAEESPWSTTLVFGTGDTRRWEALSGAESDGAVTRDLHVAMLRFCAARSDCFAVLALPRHHREPEALAHAAWLNAALGGIAEPGDVGARTLSFGALYHPWTVVRTSSAAAPLRAIPPDGATTGVMAARANELGAWAAPANRPLAGVAILDPKLPESVRATFLGRRVNAVAPFPRGFMTWSEETLSPDPELRGVGVRRLLILLRRLALREGNTYVFRPNDNAFRRLVQRQFDALLGDLYVRGAFAGATHAQGYRVVTDDSVNPPESVDQGRLIVELRVAPSRPMAFLTVRLVQAGAGITVQEG